jgi:hypothetical protein
MKRIGLPLAAVLTTVGLTLSACGGGTPSEDDIAEQLVDSEVADEEQADCIAKEVLDSDLSDDQLNAIADDDESDLDGDEITEVGEVLGEALITCTTE